MSTTAPSTSGGTPDRLAACHEGAGHGLGRQLAAALEDPVRPPHQHRDQHDEREQVAVAGAEQGDAVALDQAQDQAAADRARDVAHAADHQRHHALEHGLEAHVRVDVVVVHADQQAGDAAQRRGDREHAHVHQIDVDAHLLGRVAVLGGRARRPAELGEAQEHVEQAGADDADRGDHEVERADRAAADGEAPVGQLARQGTGVGRIDQVYRLVEDQADADGREQGRDLRAAAQRPKADALDRDAEQPRAEDRPRAGSAAAAGRDRRCRSSRYSRRP